MLRAATSAGLAVPQWLITNVSAEAQLFFERHLGDVVAKPMVTGRIGGSRTFWTTRVTEQQIQALGAEPYLFQRRIHRLYEVRVTVFADEVVAVRIGVTESDAETDWRRSSRESLTYEPHVLNPRDTDGLMRLMDRYDLRFATADFIVDRSGESWFLEINPNGQWAWLEEDAGVDLTSHLARILVR